MRSEKKKRSTFIDSQSEDKIIDQLRRNTVPNYFTNREKEELSARLNKVINSLVKG
jgi:hypothetical protein